MSGSMGKANHVRANLRPQLLSGKSTRGADLSKDWLAAKWPTLLDAHVALPSPGRAIAIGNAQYMVSHGIAKISVCKATVTFDPRTLSKREVVAVETWLGSQVCEGAEDQVTRSDIHTLERSLGAQAEHHHSELVAQFTEQKSDFREVLVDILKPAYPEDASFAEKRVHNQNARDELTRQNRLLIQEENLVKARQGWCGSE
jgi:DNA-binding GntR family transcriptional regulator